MSKINIILLYQYLLAVHHEVVSKTMIKSFIYIYQYHIYISYIIISCSFLMSKINIILLYPYLLAVHHEVVSPIHPSSYYNEVYELVLGVYLLSDTTDYTYDTVSSCLTLPPQKGVCRLCSAMLATFVPAFFLLRSGWLTSLIFAVIVAMSMLIRST